MVSTEVSGRRRDRLITIASVPANHVYVRHLSAPDGRDDVHRLVDPRPCGAPSDQSVWWPPVMLDPAWVVANHAAFDVFHIHFGFDAQSIEDLRDVVGALRAYEKPLVYTVHDLRNPHHTDPAAHEAHLDVLVPAADQLITLTPGAAAVIADRWGRNAHVLPHPHVVDPALLGRPRRSGDEFVVGVHLKSLRANMDCLPVLRALVPVIAELPGAVLRVDVHDEVMDASGRHHRTELVGWLRSAHRRGALRLAVHEFFSDGQLWTLSARRDRPVGPSVPVRYSFGVARGLPRSGNPGRRAPVRLLRPAAAVLHLRPRRLHRAGCSFAGRGGASGQRAAAPLASDGRREA